VTTTVRAIPTPVGDARLHTDRSRHPVAALVLGHGAGKGEDSRDLAALAAALPAQGISVFRVEQPWHVSGKKVAARPEALDAATVACVNAIRVRTPLIIGGRSAGARVACRLARSLGAVGCIALAFPLHPPGRPESSRLHELSAAGVPTLVVQGERDAFGRPDDFPAGLGRTDIAAVPDADHGFAVPKRAELSQDETLALIVETVVEWVTARVG
jgi:predicted alpha/beta-hydrolase family hydrolase